tara:strand:- start:10 stop:336 length:327 start_codon:yes stop_codon:yes gene_type:complete
MHDHKSAGMPIGQGATLVIAKKMAAGPGGYADFGNNPPCPASDAADAAHAAPDAADPPAGDINPAELRRISGELANASKMHQQQSDDIAAMLEGDSPDEGISEKRELS